ncbi:MAG: CHAT domain-containing tetratricopeptide repeat protein [Acidobacteriota bacterium]
MRFELRRRSLGITWVIICFLSLARLFTASSVAQPSDDALVPSVPTATRLLSAEEGHTYRAELDAGAWLFSVTQKGVDTEVRFELPDGGELGPFNSPVGRRGTESFLVTLDRPGTVRAEIRPSGRAADGHYTAVLERLAAADDSQRSSAERERFLAESAATKATRSFAAGSLEDAQHHYRQALSVWPPSDPAGRARSLVASAVLARSLDEPGEAAERFRRALSDWQALGDRENEATTLNRLGLTLDQLGETHVALELFEKAIALWRKLDDPVGEVPARLNLCLALQRQGDFSDALGCYKSALHLVRELQQPNREVVVLSNLAGVYWRLGEPDRALEGYAQALAPARQLGGTRTQGRILSTRALLYYELGEAEQALIDYGRALEVFRELKHRRMEGLTLSYLGATHLFLGELDRAGTYLEQALPLLEAVGDQRGISGTLRSLGQTRGRQEDWDAAFDAYAKALELSRGLDDRRGVASLFKLLGQAHAKAGSLPRAVTELQRAVELQQQLGDRRQTAQALLELGKAYRQWQDPEQALDHLSRARELFRDLRDRAEEVRTLEATARAERDLGRSHETLAATSLAVELLEDLRTRAGGLRQRAAFFATRRGVYELHIDELMQRHRSQPGAGYDRQAFVISERSRSRALLDSVRADGHLGASLRQRLQAASRRLAAHTERQITILGRAHEPSEAAAVDREVVAALAELEGLQAEARRVDPNYSQLVEGEILHAEEVAELLDSATLLLEYVLAEPRSYLWVVSAGSMVSFELPGRETLEPLARQAHADLSTLDVRTGRTSRQALENLSGLLLAPVAERLATARRLVVVADGALHYLPFAAFPWPASGEPLVASHEIVHLPSASTLAWQRRRVVRNAPEKTLAVLADPVFDALDSRLSGAPGSPDLAAAVLDHSVRWRGDLDNLGRLAATGQEAAAIVDLVEAPSESLLATGFDAHRERVVSGELEGYRYLHFATHGLINSRHPELSGLVFALYDAHGQLRNGFLSMDDVYSLELSAEMVVLSGCQTALGREVRGEGLLGLAHGFMAAGVPRTVASLWPVQDGATARLMTQFYHGVLTEGKTPAAALIAAQRSVRKQRLWADPYFWSAFVLLGDWH